MLAVRWVELALLYAVTPLMLAWAAERFEYRRAMAPLLWVASAVALVVLLQDASFDRALLFRVPPLGDAYVRVVALRFCALAAPLLALGRWLVPGEFLRFLRRRPVLWLAFAA